MKKVMKKLSIWFKILLGKKKKEFYETNLRQKKQT